MKSPGHARAKSGNIGRYGGAFVAGSLAVFTVTDNVSVVGMFEGGELSMRQRKG